MPARKENHYRKSLKAAIIFALIVVFMFSVGGITFSYTWMRCTCTSFTDFFYSSDFWSLILRTFTGVMSVFTLSEILKGKSALLPLFIFIQLINCMVCLWYIIEMFSEDFTTNRWCNLCANVLPKHLDTTKHVMLPCKFLEAIFWKLLIVTLVVQIYSLIIMYIFMISEDIPVFMEGGVNTLRPHVTEVNTLQPHITRSPAAPPSYNEAVNSVSSSCRIANVGGRMTNQKARNYCVGVHNSIIV